MSQVKMSTDGTYELFGLDFDGEEAESAIFHERLFCSLLIAHGILRFFPQ